jgi:chitin synthase
MYLAEDRILCFEIVTKKNAAWLLRYVKSAKAETDVPDGVAEFISQRRRWMNGSFFAGVYALTNFHHIFQSNHNLIRKVVLMWEFVYNMVLLFFTWFGLSFFYLTFYFLILGVVTSTSKTTERVISTSSSCTGVTDCYILFDVIKNLYISAIVVIFICSLGNRPQGSKGVYITIMLLFAFMMGVMLFFAGYSIFRIVTTANGLSFKELFGNKQFRDMVIATASTFGLYILSSLLHMDPW